MRKLIVPLVLLGTAFWLTRLINLTLLPIFTDEAIYLRWAQIALHDPVWHFISLTDGKQPLFIWLMLPFMKVVADPLLAGRLVSVAAGFFGLLGMIFLGWEVSRNNKVALVSGGLYLISPFFLWYDRVALMDGLLNVFGIWSLALSLMLVRTLRFRVALFLGLVIGGGLLTKSSADFFLYFLPATLLLFDWKSSPRWATLGKWFVLVLTAAILSQIIYNLLRISPLFYMIGQKNLTFVLSFKEFFSHPFIFLQGNLRGLGGWLFDYLTVPVILLTLLASIWALRKKPALTLVLLFWFFFPFVALAAFGKVIYPRFILFMVPPLFILSAEFMVFLTQKIRQAFILIILSLLFFSLPLYFDWQILTNPVNAPLPFIDREQFLDSWPAGFGVKETITFLKEEAAKNEIFVGTEGTFGLFPASLELYLSDNENVKTKGYWPAGTAFPELVGKAKTTPTYFISKETEKFDNPHLKLLFKYRRGRGNTFLQVFQVTAKE